MGKLIQFPCNDYYEDWQYEDYYDEEFNDMNQDYGNCEDQIKDGLVRGFIRKVLMFLLVRL